MECLIYCEWPRYSSVKMTGDCSFCWYWWNWWSSLFKLSFHNKGHFVFKEFQWEQPTNKSFPLMYNCLISHIMVIKSPLCQIQQCIWKMMLSSKDLIWSSWVCMYPLFPVPFKGKIIYRFILKKYDIL
jgi:hypothetical protein